MKNKILFALLFLVNSIYSQILDPVKWKTTIEKKSETEFVLVFDATIEKDWHFYSQYTPEGGAIATEFKFADSKNNYELQGKPEESKYKKTFNDIFGVDEYYFANTAQFKQNIKVLNPNLKEIKVNVDYQTCKQQCINDNKSFTFKLPALNIPVEKNSVQAEESPENKDTLKEFNLEKVNIKTENVIENKKEEKQSKWVLFLATLLAGVLVTFTPCVFPMIPMTVSYFLKQSAKGDRKKGKLNAFMYGFFIILIYVLISLPFHIFEGISENVFYEISTNPYLNIFFFIVFAIFAMSFLGAFEIQLPSSLANKVDGASNKGGLIGIFFMALTLIIVSFSCTGPALGLVIGGALSTDGGATLLTIAMFGFGLGLAFPFVIFALFPSMMGNLPKSGGWLNTVKVVFGFIELALAFKFLSMADLVMDWHILEREIFISVWIAIFGTLALYLFGKLSLPNDSPISNISVGRLLLGLTSLTFAIYLIPGLWGAPLNIISGFPPPLSYSESPKGIGVNQKSSSNNENNLTPHSKMGVHDIITFHNYKDGLEYAKKVNKPIFIDFTGITCVNCRRMEELVWAKPEILSILKNDVVVISLYVDDRKPLPENEIYTSKSGELITTFGKKWSDFSITKYKANVQPFYILIDLEENNLNKPVGYTPNVDEYKNWLNDGISKFKK